jgi:hypothetical protein
MDPEVAGLDPYILSEILSLGGLSEEEARLAERITGAKALEATPQPTGMKVGETYVAANPLQHAIAAMERRRGRTEREQAETRLTEIGKARQSGRAAMLSAIPGGTLDPYSVMTAPSPEAAEEAAGGVRRGAALRRNLGMAGALSGDPTAARVGAGLVSEAEQGMRGLGEAGQTRLKMAMAAEEAKQRRTKEEADRALRERSIASQETYRQAATGMQAARLGVEKERLGLEQARMGVGAAAGGEESAITLKAKAIIEGRQPPDMRGLYRMALPISAELERRGFDLSKAQMQWDAQKRLVSSLNGPQQIRLGQATRMVKDSLDKVEELYGKWEKAGLATQFPLINRADIATAMAAGGERGAAATALNTLINDLILEQATVLMGGNAPTEQAMKHAEANLNAAWGGKTFREALELVKFNTNTRMRVMQESQPNLGPGYAGTPNPYARRGGEEGAPSATPKATHRFNPATGRIEVISGG